MNSKEIDFKQAIKSYYANKSLSNEQQENLAKIEELSINRSAELQTSKKIVELNWLRKAVWAQAIAASLLCVLALFQYFEQPDIIEAVYADVIEDSAINNGMQPFAEKWMIQNQLMHIPEGFVVSMSKMCNIGKDEMLHIRVKGQNQGSMNIFFHTGSVHDWERMSGIAHEMRWRIVEVKNDLNLIVMYTHDMREQAVEKVISKILSKSYA